MDESHGGFFSRNKTRKSGGNLPVPMHQRTVSSPVPLIETTSPDALPIHHKKYPSSIDQRVSENHERISFKQDLKKLSLDSCLLSEKSPKRTSSDISDKHSKKNNFNADKTHQKRSLDEMRLSSQNSSQTASENSFILMTPETPVPKSIAATPELLAELLKGSSEKQVNENQNKKHHHQHSIISSTGIALPTAVLKCLVCQKKKKNTLYLLLLKKSIIFIELPHRTESKEILYFKSNINIPNKFPPDVSISIYRTFRQNILLFFQFICLLFSPHWFNGMLQ